MLLHLSASQRVRIRFSNFPSSKGDFEELWDEYKTAKVKGSLPQEWNLFLYWMLFPALCSPTPRPCTPASPPWDERPLALGASDGPLGTRPAGSLDFFSTLARERGSQGVQLLQLAGTAHCSPPRG